MVNAVAVLATLASCSALIQNPIRKNSWALKAVDDSATSSESDAIVAVARSFALTGFGVSDPSILADNFVCSGPNFLSSDREKYISGLRKETSAFQRAIPDFDVRAYGFIADEKDPNTIWFKIRPSGTLSGPFTYKGEVYISQDKPQVELPVQTLSATIKNRKVVRVTAGYVSDKLSGNTGGLVGPAALLYKLGEAPPELSYLPPALALKKFFGRNRKPITRKALSSPFPEQVMFVLASKLVDASLGAAKPELLSEDFQFSSPLTTGPVPKKEYIAEATQYNFQDALPDLSSSVTSIEIDSYDPERVWLILRRSGTHTRALRKGDSVVAEASGKTYQSAPEAVSVSINSDGLCYRVTAGYVLDREQGNTEGLGGDAGLLQAIGASLPSWETRSIPESLQLLFGGGPPRAAVPAIVPAPAPALVAKQAVTASSTAPKPATPVPVPVTAQTKKSEAPSLFGGLFSPAPAPAPKAAAPVKAAPVAPAPKATPTPVKATPVAPAPKATPVKATPVAPAPKAAPTPVKATPVAPAPKAAPTPVKVVPSVSTVTKTPSAPSPIKTKTGGGFFGLFTPAPSSSATKPAAVPVPQVATPASKPAAAPILKAVAPLSKAPTKPVVASVPKTIAPTPSPAPPAPKAAPAAKSTFSNQAPASSSTQTNPKLLNTAVKKAIGGIKGIDTNKVIDGVDKALQDLVDAKISSENFSREVTRLVGSKDTAFSIFPDLIGCLPRGTAKTALNRFFQEQAF